MKKHLLHTVLFLAGITLLTSCLKDDPKNNGTVFYGYQEIPNINYYMPQNLLYVMDSLHQLHYGEEPPKIEGGYTATNLNLILVKKVPSSHWVMTPTSALGTQFFKLYEQHFGISHMKFWNEKGTPSVPQSYYVETSSTDSTVYYTKNGPTPFLHDSIAPIYFKDGKLHFDDFNNVYIIGKDSYFTLYYYEVRHIFTTNFQPLNAVIISGKIDNEAVITTDTINHTTDTVMKPVIKDFVMGIETMRYLKEGSSLNMILQYGYLPTPGDVIIIRNLGDVVPGEFEN